MSKKLKPYTILINNQPRTILLDPRLEIENTKKREAIVAKEQQGIPLTAEEQHFSCEQMRWELKSTLPECEDVFYREAFMSRVPGELGYERMTPENHARFKALVSDWEELMSKGGYTDTALKTASKETKLEVREFKKQYKKSDAGYEQNYFELMAWSKFRFIQLKKIFQFGIKADEYLLHLNGETIIFNRESCNHILARHFGHVMKHYHSERDHFYGVFKHTELHKDLEKIFMAIDKSGKYKKDSILDVSIQLKGEKYKIFTKKETYFETGKTGAQTRYRLSTLFPISDSNMIQELNDCYTETKINKNLGIYVKCPVN